MSKAAEDIFFSEAFHRNEQERGNWQLEVLNDIIELRQKHGVTMIGNQSIEDLDGRLELAKKLEEHVIATGNDIFSDIIIRSYLAIEDNERIKELVSNVWVGLWDAPDAVNAGINTKPFYDGSYLVRFTSDLQILIRKVVELFTTEVFALILASQDGKVPEFLTYMLKIELHDIVHEDDEIGVKNIIDMFPDSMQQAYNQVFQYAFLAGCAFVIFHEIGHRIEDVEELARYYGVEPSVCVMNTDERSIKSEFNADLVSMKIIKKIFGRDEAICWLGYAGVLLCLLTIAIGESDPTLITDHPSTQSRYFRAKEFITEEYGPTAQREIFLRTDAVANLLKCITDWSCDNWWKNS